MGGKSSQTTMGKAFEYACVIEIYNRYESVTNALIAVTPQLVKVKECFESLSADTKDNLLCAARAAVRVIDRYEPHLSCSNASDPLILTVQADSQGQIGDVRDVLCIRKGNLWEIGLSCKHNHHAVKHSRLSGTLDFGEEWFGYPCSDTYFDTIRPVFSALKMIRDTAKQNNREALWADIPDKAERYYVPVLEAFVREIVRLSTVYSDVPSKLVHYLIGRNDFYKVITNDSKRVTRVEAINLAGTLSQASQSGRPITKIPVLKTPSKFYFVGFKTDPDGKQSTNTILVACDNGWEISMRLHNASSRVEPSLKFDVQLVSFPSQLFSNDEPWDI
ncbi:HaeIII family restriction endonuclease [Trueperella sp. LYQ143]|uniref:HaeIII family restriction endonuclease n=1 Tax=Trueperella sp. LYQ143 TaxID=3391059 RepID=UPI00398391D5